MDKAKHDLEMYAWFVYKTSNINYDELLTILEGMIESVKLAKEKGTEWEGE